MTIIRILGTAFYFAAESEEELAAWLDCLSMAALALDIPASKSLASEGKHCNFILQLGHHLCICVSCLFHLFVLVGAVFSETEDEGDESEIADSCFPSPKMRKFTNFLSGHSNHSSHPSSSSGSPKPARSHQNLASSGDSKT